MKMLGGAKRMKKRIMALLTVLLLLASLAGTAAAGTYYSNTLVIPVKRPQPTAAATPIATPAPTADASLLPSTAPEVSASPLPSASPEASTSPEASASPMPEEMPVPDGITVEIVTTIEQQGAQPALGDIVVLTAVIGGADGRELSYQWERTVDGAWVAIADATEPLIRFPLAEDTSGSEWRLRVTVQQ